MADPIVALPVPTKNILELDDAAPFDGSEFVEVVQGGNSRKAKVLPETDAEMLGAPKAASPDLGDDSNRIATTEWVQDALDGLNLNPDAPGVPTLPTLEIRTQLAQDGTVVMRAILGWTAPANMKPRWSYEVRHTKDGVDPDSRTVGEEHAKIPVESGSLYQFKVRTVSKDEKSAWVDFDPITPVKKSIVPPSPTALTANGGHRRVVLRWADPRIINTDYYDHAETWIYRATSNNFLAASFLDKTASTAFVDGDLPNDADYWYWIVHVDTSRNQSNKHPSSNTAGEHAKTNRITDDDTDDDAPGAPTNLVLAPRVERTDDGNLDVNLIITWDAPVGGGLGEKGNYIVWIQESVSGNVHTQDSPRDDRSIKYRGVRTNRTYDVKVRARKGGGKVGPWCSTVQVTIGKKADYNTAVPSGLTVAAEHKRAVLSWDDLTGLDALDYKFTKIYRSLTNNFAAAVVVGRPRDNAFIDGKVNNVANYWYWIAHVDRSMNEGPRYPAGPATNNGINVLTPQIGFVDLADDSIDKSKIKKGITLHQEATLEYAEEFTTNKGKVVSNIIKSGVLKITNPMPSPIQVSFDAILIVTASSGNRYEKASGVGTVTLIRTDTGKGYKVASGKSGKDGSSTTVLNQTFTLAAKRSVNIRVSLSISATIPAIGGSVAAKVGVSVNGTLTTSVFSR